MNSKKIYSVALSLAVLVGAVGCTTTDGKTGLNTNQDRLSTQTRINRDWNRNDNVGMDNTLTNNPDLNNGTNNNLNNGMVRNGNRFTTSIRNNNNTRNNNYNQTANDIAKQIVDEIPEVKDAKVVLNDNRCIVGVDLENNAANNNVVNNNVVNNTTTNNTTVNNRDNTTLNNSLRDKIRKIVEEHTNVKVENISISSDPQIFERIGTLSRNMTNTVGNDFNEFTNDIENLVNDIVNPRGTR